MQQAPSAGRGGDAADPEERHVTMRRVTTRRIGDLLPRGGYKLRIWKDVDKTLSFFNNRFYCLHRLLAVNLHYSSELLPYMQDKDLASLGLEEDDMELISSDSDGESGSSSPMLSSRYRPRGSGNPPASRQLWRMHKIL